MKFFHFILACLLGGLLLAGCGGKAELTPTVVEPPVPTSTPLLFPTSTLAVPTSPPLPTQPLTSPTLSLPALTPTPADNQRFVVILVKPEERLAVHEGPGLTYRVVGTLPYDATDVRITGRQAQADNITWVEIQRISDETLKGWVNARFLTQYVPTEAFCNPETENLIRQFEQAILQADGRLLASLVSPVHGVDIWLWRTGRAINFDAAHARWVFDSTYVHNWGVHPASGQETRGSFQEEVLPALRDGIATTHEVRCDDLTVPGLAKEFVWPAHYRNIHAYKIYKPATPGVDLDWRVWLVGIEYVDNKPYLFALIHYQWEP